MNTQLKYTELVELLQQDEYAYTSPERLYIRDFEYHNTWTTPEVLELWDTMTDTLGYPPNPTDYIMTGLKLTMEYWYKDSDQGLLPKYTMTNRGWETTYLQWSPNIEQAIMWRLGRMYESFMAEYSLVSLLKTLYPDFLLVGSNKMDLVMGVDLAVASKEHNKTFYIHVTKDSEWALTNIKKKADKRMWLKDKNNLKQYWQRRYTESHIPFLYDKYESTKSTNINGHYTFKEDYIIQMVEHMLEQATDTYTDSELIDFHNYLLHYDLHQGGIADMAL